ncbi:MAG: hypothetical protein DRP83_01215 [Planctomycetota bacterium]|nr:MAG: hypothetical protein DRP83_01215 [Planctomycetota bacterium]
MRNKKKHIGVTMGTLLCFVGILSLMGCWDATKRAAGRNIQKATAQATALYAQANSLLGQAQLATDGKPLPGEDKSLDPAILKLLSQAEAVLTTALKENYQGRPDNAVPHADVALAKMTLGEVRNLQGQCYANSARMALRRAAASLNKAKEQLDQAQRGNSFVQAFDLRVRNARQTLKDLDAQAQAIEKNKATISAEKTRLARDIAARQATIAKLNKTIEADGAQASSLRKDSSLSTGEASLAKLDAALKIEEGIRTDRVKIAKIQDQVRGLKGQGDYCDYQLSQADHKLSQIAANRKNCKFTASRDAEFLRVQAGEVAALWKLASEAQAQAGRACSEALDLAGQARRAWNSAGEELSQAGRLGSNKQATILSINGESKALASAMEMTLWDMNRRVDRFVKQAEALWGQLHAARPAEPVDKSLKDFLDRTASSAQDALAQSKAALTLRTQASQASPPARRWYYQRDLVGAYVRYSQSLDAAGQPDQAQAMLSKARELVGQIERQARQAEQKQSIAGLKKLTGMKTEKPASPAPPAKLTAPKKPAKSTAPKAPAKPTHPKKNGVLKKLF